MQRGLHALDGLRVGPWAALASHNFSSTKNTHPKNELQFDLLNVAFKRIIICAGNDFNRSWGKLNEGSYLKWKLWIAAATNHGEEDLKLIRIKHMNGDPRSPTREWSRLNHFARSEDKGGHGLIVDLNDGQFGSCRSKLYNRYPKPSWACEGGINKDLNPILLIRLLIN